MSTHNMFLWRPVENYQSILKYPPFVFPVKPDDTFSSPEPLGSLVSLWYSHGPSSVCHPFTIFKDLLKNCWANRSQIHGEPPWVGGTKICLGHLGHMTKMAAMPIYGKKTSKIFFCGTKGPMTLGGM